MTTTERMIATHPFSAARESLVETLQSAADCAQVCSICADACLNEATVGNLTRCITINLDCATICEATATVLTRQGLDQPSILIAQLKACMEACRVCAEECRRCELACRELLAALG